jgi:hypothetical protein
MDPDSIFKNIEQQRDEFLLKRENDIKQMCNLLEDKIKYRVKGLTTPEFSISISLDDAKPYLWHKHYINRMGFFERCLYRVFDRNTPKNSKNKFLVLCSSYNVDTRLFTFNICITPVE